MMRHLWEAFGGVGSVGKELPGNCEYGGGHALRLEQLEPRMLMSVVINEVHVDPDVKVEKAEFIELHNTGDVDEDISGWFFSDGVDYVFEAGTVIPAGGYLVVGEDPGTVLSKWGVNAVGPWDGKLSNEGEDIQLRDAQGNEVDEVDYQIGFPWPTVGDEPGYSMELINPEFENDIGGNWRSSVGAQGSDNEILGENGVWSYFEGTSEPSMMQGEWRGIGFDDSSWTDGVSAIGYGDGHVVTTLNMQGNYSTFYLRKTFNVGDADAVGSLDLDVQFDDGVNMWINGVNVVSENVASSEMPYNGVANSSSENLAFRSFTLSNPGAYLVDGENVIAVQVLNRSLSGSSDAWFDARLVKSDGAAAGPTPGARNSVYSANAAPQMRQVNHGPEQPVSGEAVTITAKITDPDGVGSVALEYQVVEPGAYISLEDPEYQTNWVTVSMVDDGMNGDAVGGDDIYTAVLPGEVQEHRRLVRYRLTAMDSLGASVRGPYEDDTQPNFAYFVYDGVPTWTGAAQPGVSSEVEYNFNELENVEVYQLITKNQDVVDSQYHPGTTRSGGYGGSDYLWSGAMVVDGVVYDHIHYRARGGVWRYSMGKNMWKFDFNRGHGFEMKDDYGDEYETKLDKLNFSALIQQGNFLNRGEQGLFEGVGFKLFNLAGVEGPNTSYVHFRVIDGTDEQGGSQFDGDFWGLYLAMEQPDGNLLDEHDLPDGNFYKMEGGSGELNNQGPDQPTNKSDLNAFINTYTNTTPSEQWWRDNMDLDKYYSYRAIVEGIHHYDIGYGKNYYYLNNPETGKWETHPWDLDLTWADNMYGNGAEPFRDRVLPISVFGTEYRNRMREIRDLLYNDEQAGMLIDEQASFVYTPGEASFVDADRAKWDYNPIMTSSYVNSSKAGWGRYYESAATDDFAGMIQKVKNYVASRGNWIDSTILTDEGQIPDTPVVSYTGEGTFPINGLMFETSDFAGSGGFDGMEWRIARVTDPNAPGFDRTAPRGYEIDATWESGELNLFESDVHVPGNELEVGETYRVRVRMKDGAGRYSHWSAPVQFEVGEATGPLIEGLRVTEVHYHPADAGEGETGTFEDNDFEFIELQNVSGEAIQLENVRFDNGIEFTFPAMTLGAGEYVVVVSNLSAFSERYNAGDILVAGEFVDTNLSNGGERIELLDAAGGEIQRFSFDDAWYPVTDGGGFSLSIIDAEGALTEWDVVGGWKPSALVHGSPGAGDSGLVPGAVVINEVMTRSTGAVGDWVEIHNTTSEAIDISGWYLSNEGTMNETLKKYQIGAGTVIASGGYLVLDELNDFGVGSGDGGSLIGFELSALGGEVFLSSSEGGTLSGYRVSEAFGGADEDVSFGRVENSVGDVRFVAQAASSMGAANGAARVDDVVLNEIMYHPAEGGDEFIELYNRTVSVIDLAGYAFTDGVDFVFGVGDEIAAGGYALVVGIDPVSYRTTYGIDASVPVFGPYGGMLSDGGERVTLVRDGAVLGGVGGEVPRVEVESVGYDDRLPWAAQADGLGSALGRVDSNVYGDDPAVWAPSTNGGTPGGVNVLIDGTPPSVPVGVMGSVVSEDEIALSWGASSDGESGVAFYTVYRNGNEVGTTTETSFVDMVTGGVPYTYEVSATNGDGVESGRSVGVDRSIMTLLSASALSSTQIVVTFSQSVEIGSATDLGNYDFLTGTLLSVSVGVDPRVVTLNTEPLGEGVLHTVVINDVMGLSGGELAPDSEISFAYPAGLEAYFPFNEGNGTQTLDNAGQGLVGTLNGGVSWIDGQVGRGLSFDGVDDYVGVSTDLAQWLGGTGSVAFWMKTTQTGNNTVWLAPGVIGVEEAGGGNDVFWGWLNASGQINVSASNGPAASSNTPVNDGIWHHVVLTRDHVTGALEVWVDGDLNDTNNGTAGLMTNAFARIGSIEDTGGSPTYFAGQLDEVRIYSRILGETEILLLADQTPPRVEGVVLASTAWDTGYYAQLDSGGVGDGAQGGYAVPVGGGDQLLPLVHASVNQVKVRFSEHVVVPGDAFKVIGYETESVVYDPVTFTATLTLSTPLSGEFVFIQLLNDVVDGGGVSLDGEWVNPTDVNDPSSSMFPSGDGNAGGVFTFGVRVRPGDVDENGVVDDEDIDALFGKLGSRDVMRDVDGSGAIDDEDVDVLVEDVIGTAYGDSTLDKVVDLEDLAKLATNFGQSGKGWAEGDYTGDGEVDLSDLAKLATNFGVDLRGGAGASAGASEDALGSGEALYVNTAARLGSEGEEMDWGHIGGLLDEGEAVGVV